MAWVRGQRAAADKIASGLASDAAPHRAGRGICRREPRSANPARSRRGREYCVSSRYLLTWRRVAVELAEQSITVLLGRLGKLLNEAFNLLTSGVFEGFGTAEIDSIGFHQFGIEFVLADDLAEPVADLVTSTTIAVPVSVGILGWKLTLIGSPRRWTGIRADLLDRADANAIRLTQGAIDGSSFRYAHLGAADQQRNVGRIGVAVPDETGGLFGRKHRRLEDETIDCGITQRIHGLDVDTATSLPARQPKKTGVRNVPIRIDDLHLAGLNRKSKVSS